MNKENLILAFQMLLDQFSVGSLAWMILYIAILVIAIIYFIRSIYATNKRSVEGRYYTLLCVPIILWVALTLLIGETIITQTNIYFDFFNIALNMIIPAFLCLHIHSQVSYKPITATTWAKFLILPILVIILSIVREINPGIILLEGNSNGISLIYIIELVFFFIVIIRSYLLCFNVFYQMPKHMKLSTYQMIVAITAIALVKILTNLFLLPAHAADLLNAIAYAIALYALFEAFFIANASNVIVTSRDLIFSELSTIVITVSLKGYILDWNKKEKKHKVPLPEPRYKEAYEKYRERILATCNGVVSPYDENIITTEVDGNEHHYLLSSHSIEFQGRQFGNIVEISEVTKTYDMIRYFEDIASYDKLTGLKNRNAYLETVKTIISASSMPLMILIGDVNNLKKINDTMGHLYGDKLLIAIARIVEEEAPANAFVARIGGDEIVLLIPNSEDDVAISFEKRVAERCSGTNIEGIGTPSISWGHQKMSDEKSDYNEIFRLADGMMYEEKKKTKEISLSGIV